jgi:hypothetical protein
MRITTIGRGSIGGTLARLWTAAGHQVTALGRDGGDASDADVVLLAVRHADIPAALAGVTGLEGKTVIETSNRLDGEAPHEGHASNAEYVKAVVGGPTAKAFNLNFGKLLEGAAQAPNRPDLPLRQPVSRPRPDLRPLHRASHLLCRLLAESESSHPSSAQTATARPHRRQLCDATASGASAG